MRELRCENICKSFDGVKALYNVTMRFRPSNINAIIGPNGAGKTTLLNILSGLVRPERGECFLGATNIGKLSAYMIAQAGVGRTFQDVRLISRLNVLDNVLIAFPRQKGEKLISAVIGLGDGDAQAVNRGVALRLLAFVGLDKKIDHESANLSYGEQKLLTLACCLATGAEVLLMDEPVSGVHPEMIARILTCISQLREEGKTIVFIEHNLTAVRAIADNVVLMSEGSVLAEGQTAEVLNRPEIMEAYLD